MGNYDYGVKREIEEKIKSEIEGKISKLRGENKSLGMEILNLGYYRGSAGQKHVDIFENDFYKNPSLKMSEKLKKEFKPLIDAFVPKRMQEQFYYIADRLNQFPYSRGYNRRTVRTRGYGPHVFTLLKIIKNYSNYFFLEGDITDGILGNYKDEDKMMFAHDSINSYNVAAAIDSDGGKTAAAIKEAVLSENNNVTVTWEMIKGVYMSSNKELHSLMGDFLLAAKLQEGLRQALCESLDEGTTDAFITVFKVIEDNNLIRFSSVKRAVSTWIGIFDENNTDRISQKILELMSQSLNDENKRREYLNSNDSIELSVGLWATGFYEVTDVMAEMRRLIKQGTKNQRLTVSYYNHSLQLSRFKQEIASVAIEEYSDELDTMACFLPEYIDSPQTIISGFLEDDENGISYNRPIYYEPSKVKITDYFKDKEELERHYNILLDIYNKIPKKELVFSPCIFPWYTAVLSKSNIVQLLCLFAYISGDEDKMDFASSIVSEISSEGWTSNRANAISLLFAHPKTREQRQRVIKFIGNAEGSTSARAYAIVEKMQLTDEDYEEITDMLRFKRANLRADLIRLIMKQDDKSLAKSIETLINDKNEEKRTAALDMILQLSSDEKRKSAYEAVKTLPAGIPDPTSKEKILIDQLTGESKEAREITNARGYNIYDPDEEFDFIEEVYLEKEPDSKDLYNMFFPLKEKELIGIFEKLDKFISDNQDYEYENEYGSTQLFGNSFNHLKLKEEELKAKKDFDCYPLADLLRDFYNREIKRYDVLCQLWDYWYLDTESKLYKAGEDWYKTIFKKVPYSNRGNVNVSHVDTLRSILGAYLPEYREEATLFRRTTLIFNKILHNINDGNKYITYKDTSWNDKIFDAKCMVSELPIIDTEVGDFKYFSSDSEFEKAFKLGVALEEKCKESAEEPFGMKYYHQSNTHFSYSNRRDTRLTAIDERWAFKAYSLGILTQNMLIKMLIEDLDFNSVMVGVSLVKNPGSFKKYEEYKISNLFGSDFWEESQKVEYNDFLKENKIAIAATEIYDKIVPTIMAVELKRGDTSTIFSNVAAALIYVEGIDYLVEILKALGNDTLDRGGYYSWNSYYKDPSKKLNLSHLLKSCYPSEGETGETLREKLKGSGIKEARLVQTAMYAPQWIDIIEEYLGWHGLKSGCYYFMAHMNESLDEEKKAIVAKYSPLTPEELRDGAFDIDWFKEAYEALGKQHFSLLYDSAKYIADGTMHTRARKYADAATGSVKAGDLKKQISEKRNKDLLMSYSLIPLDKGEEDIVSRYEFIEQFRKESKQFGSQRQTSENRAADMALKNLSINAGYSDVTRLILSMETKLMKQLKDFLEWKAVDDVSIRISIDDSGSSKLEYQKGEKLLKSLPAKLKKDPYVLEIKDVLKKFRNQYSRTCKMMEDSMENVTSFTIEEIRELFGNPIARAIIKNLVFKSGDVFGFATEEGRLVSFDGTESMPGDKNSVTIAHPFHMFKAGIWHEYQKYLFDNKIKQSFKQVFREIYVKLDEEKDQYASKMFAGNQIQPGKTVGCLKTRKWVADYEDGLQKVYYKDNVIARIYAQADWFSPSDVEEPTLEWVEFSDRKTFKPIKIDDIPDIIFSEVMRDVDLAVSVAHAGGVDPETSHSTIEMRRTIIEFNLPLLKLSNVTLKDNHAIIDGSIGKYSVHLGSGVVHKMGGAMISILPVHSQNRGKLFLPFVDDDPKTAEIISKIVLLSEDKKIKDPVILEQIKR